MKITFSQTFKALKNAENLMIYRKGNDYIMADGHFIVKVSKYFYEPLFNLKSGLFRILEPGQGIRFDRGTERELLDFGPKMAEMLEQYTEGHCTPSRYLIELMRGKKPSLARIFKNDNGDDTVISEDFYKIAQEVATGDGIEWHNNNKKSGVQAVSKSTGEAFAFLLPINAPDHKPLPR